jgi:hypothetical protein
VAHSLRTKTSWVAYPRGFGFCKGGSLLIHAGQSEEEPTLCKNHPSAKLRAGKGAAPKMHLGRFARVMSNTSHIALEAEGRGCATRGCGAQVKRDTRVTGTASKSPSASLMDKKKDGKHHRPMSG